MKLSLSEAVGVAGAMLVGASGPSCSPSQIREQMDQSEKQERVMLRGETSRVLLTSAGLFQPGEDACKGENPFPDVRLDGEYCSDKPVDCQAICKGQALGILNGHGKGSPHEGTFRPEDEINRAEGSKIQYVIEGKPVVPDNNYSDVDPDVWFAKPAAHAKAKNVFPGDKFEAAKPLTPSEVEKLSQ